MSQNLGELASTVGPSSQSASKESHTIEANRELQQILAANIEVPQTLMHAFNMFSSVASQCGTLAKTDAYIEWQKRIDIEQSDFMTEIAKLVDSKNIFFPASGLPK